MSAMAAVITGEEIHLFADAAFYDYETGRLTAIFPKVWQIPGVNGVFVSRGSGLAYPALQEILSDYEWSSWDELKQSLPFVWERFDDLMDGNIGDVMLAGFSEEHDRPEVLYRTTGDKYEGFHPGYTYIYTEGCTSFGCEIEAGDDPCKQAVEAFESARRKMHDISSGRINQPVMAHTVGGALTHTVLTRNNIVAETLIEWPDEVGMKIAA